jgi:hypothetical protein
VRQRRGNANGAHGNGRAGPGLVSATCLLATDLFQQFGLPEAQQVTRNGELRRPYWSSGFFQHVEKWPADCGVSITDERL